MATQTRTNRKTAQAKTQPESEKPKVEYGEREEGSLSGNITMDPELRFTASGRAVCNLNVAVNERVQNEETGEWEDTDPEFYKINVWGTQGEHCAEAFQRGDRIVAIGWFQDRTWVNKDGEKITTTEFTAKDIGPSMLFRQATIKRTQRKTS